MASRAEPADSAPPGERDGPLPALERNVLAAMDAVLDRFDAAMRPLHAAPGPLALAPGGPRGHRPSAPMALHQNLVALLARGTTTAGDLRVSAAMLHVLPCIQRINGQCAVIAERIPELGRRGDSAAVLRAGIAHLEQLARAQLADARDALAARDSALAEQLPLRAALVSAASRELAQSPAIAGPDPGARELAAAVGAVTNGLEQISEDAVEIAEQVVAMTSGLFAELAGDT